MQKKIPIKYLQGFGKYLSELNDLYGVTNNTQVIPVVVVVEKICSEHSFLSCETEEWECNAPSEIISPHCESPNSNTSQKWLEL